MSQGVTNGRTELEQIFWIIGGRKGANPDFNVFGEFFTFVKNVPGGKGEGGGGRTGANPDFEGFGEFWTFVKNVVQGGGAQRRKSTCYGWFEGLGLWF